MKPVILRMSCWQCRRVKGDSPGSQAGDELTQWSEQWTMNSEALTMNNFRTMEGCRAAGQLMSDDRVACDVGVFGS